MYVCLEKKENIKYNSAQESDDSKLYILYNNNITYVF